MVETKPKETKETTEKELKKMSYIELIEKAKEIGIKNPAQYTKKDLLFELGGGPEGVATYDMRDYYEKEDIAEAKENKMQLPGRTTFWEKDREKESAGNDEHNVRMITMVKTNFLIVFSKREGKGQSPFPLYPFLFPLLDPLPFGPKPSHFPVPKFSRFCFADCLFHVFSTRWLNRFLN